ncbi:MAG: flagellar export protein FliJ [Chthoniobacter sp.]|nr:flagellar export protein FliJ [Chthoniobacter sp.]
MKPFRYRLETVLSLRLREEDQAREVYSQSLQARARAEAKLLQERTTLEEYHTALCSARAGVSNRQHQLLFLNALKQQQGLCDRCAAEFAVVEKMANQQREVMLAARRRREALSRLKERQQHAWQIEAARVEEVMIGDLITARYGLCMREVGA